MCDGNQKYFSIKQQVFNASKHEVFSGHSPFKTFKIRSTCQGNF